MTQAVQPLAIYILFFAEIRVESLLLYQVLTSAFIRTGSQHLLQVLPSFFLHDCTVNRKFYSLKILECILLCI